MCGDSLSVVHPQTCGPVREVCHERAMGMEALEALHNHIQILVGELVM